MSSARILLIEDDEDISTAIEILLGRVGHRTIRAADGLSGLDVFEEERPSLVVLDIGLPKLDGWSVLERIRQHSEVPVLVLTARGLEADKVRGLLSGADDYLTKPFSNEELVARITALLRRAPAVADESSVFDDGEVQVNFVQHTVQCRGTAVELTPSEFRLLATLVRHQGQVLSQGDLLELAWHDPTRTGPGRVKFTVLSLRRKLGWHDVTDSPVETVRGFGYRYRESVS
jgi:DNA-binding response OmpR family regulator